MNNEITWLLIFFYDNRLIRIALSFYPDDVNDDCIENPLEPENQEQIKNLLPLHHRSYGPIIEITEIHGVVKSKDEEHFDHMMRYMMFIRDNGHTESYKDYAVKMGYRNPKEFKDV